MKSQGFNFIHKLRNLGFLIRPQDGHRRKSAPVSGIGYMGCDVKRVKINIVFTDHRAQNT